MLELDIKIARYTHLIKIDDKKYLVAIVMTFSGTVGKLFDKK